MIFEYLISSTTILVLGTIAVADISVDYYYGHPQLRTEENLKGFECADKVMEAHCLKKCGLRHICVLDKCFCVEKDLPGGYDKNVEESADDDGVISQISNRDLGGHVELIRPVLQMDSVGTRNSDGPSVRSTIEDIAPDYPRPYSESNVFLLRGAGKLNKTLLESALQGHNVLASPIGNSKGLLAELKANLADILKDPTGKSDASEEKREVKSDDLLASQDEGQKDMLQWNNLLKYSSESDKLLKNPALESNEFVPELPTENRPSLIKQVAQQADIYLIRPVRQYPSKSKLDYDISRPSLQSDLMTGKLLKRGKILNQHLLHWDNHLARRPLHSDNVKQHKLMEADDVVEKIPREPEIIPPYVERPSIDSENFINQISNSESENEMHDMSSHLLNPALPLPTVETVPPQSAKSDASVQELLRSDNILPRMHLVSEKLPPYIKHPQTKFDDFIIPVLPHLLRIANLESENEQQSLSSQLDKPLPPTIQEIKNAVIVPRPVLRHHIAHFCPNLDIARGCIRKCMKVGKPAFCGKDHVCYCGHDYGTPGDNEVTTINPKDVYAQYKDLYQKYFGPLSE